MKSDSDKQRTELPSTGSELDLSLTSLPDLTAFVRAALDVSLENIVSTVTMDHSAEASASHSPPEMHVQVPRALTDSEDQLNTDNLTPSSDYSALLLQS